MELYYFYLYLLRGSSAYVAPEAAAGLYDYLYVIFMIAGAVIGLLVAHPTMNLPVFTGFNNEKMGTLFPILFVTVACGAVSGFHSLVSSGTSSKTVENEKDMLKVG